MTRKRSYLTPSAFKAEEIRTLRDQITSNIERAWEITGGTEDQLTGTMVQISQVVAQSRALSISIPCSPSLRSANGTAAGLRSGRRLESP